MKSLQKLLSWLEAFVSLLKLKKAEPTATEAPTDAPPDEPHAPDRKSVV